MSHFLEGQQYNKSKSAKTIRDAFEERGYTNVKVYWHKDQGYYARAFTGWYIEADQFELDHEHFKTKDLEHMIQWYNVMTNELSTRLCRLKALASHKLPDINNVFNVAHHYVTLRHLRTFADFDDRNCFIKWNEHAVRESFYLTDFKYFEYCVKQLNVYAGDESVSINDVMSNLKFENYLKMVVAR